MRELRLMIKGQGEGKKDGPVENGKAMRRKQEKSRNLTCQMGEKGKREKKEE